jgi:hypothetical protein
MPGWNNDKTLLGYCVRQVLYGRLILLLLASFGVARRSDGQWVPPPELRNVPILSDCKMTRHGVGVTLQPTVFYPNGAIF